MTDKEILKEYHMTILDKENFAEEWEAQCSRLSRYANLGKVRIIPSKKSRMYRERFLKEQREISKKQQEVSYENNNEHS